MADREFALSDELVADLQQLNAEKKYRWLKFSVEETQANLKAVRDKVKDVDEFWLQAMCAHPEIALTSTADQEAMSYLTDIELKQDGADPRPYELVFHFKENPFFSNKTLSKKYSLPKELPAIKDGKVTHETFQYDDSDFVISGTKPDWKSEDKNLVAKQPRKINASFDDDEDEDNDETDFEGDVGSFFVYFDEEGDQRGLGHTISDELLPDLLDLLFEDDSDIDIGEFDDEEDDDDEGSVDLEEEEEQPKKKKQKM